MILWIILLIFLLLAGTGCLVFLISRVKRFSFIKVLSKDKKGIARLISALLVLLPLAPVWLAWGSMNAVIILLHLGVFWVIADLIDRQDASEELDFGGSRASVAELTQNLDKSKFSLVLDHQPREYDAEAAAATDLVLSGHTHGGQLFPLMQFSRLFAVSGDDQIYGIERRLQTDFIVTSGISDWAIKFKTGCFSEYVILDIHNP